MPDSLNARMAAALAPVLEEEAVYDRVWVCSFGHVETGYLRDWNDADARLCRASVGNHWGGCRAPARKDKRPKDFADPAVGWGVLERYLKATSSYLTLHHNTEGSVFEPHVFPDLAYQFVHEGYADTAWGAVIMAWARAMGVGEVSGDA